MSCLCCAADLQRQQIEGLRKADYQALAGAKRSGQLATINFTLDLPDELADVELTERCDRRRGKSVWCLGSPDSAETLDCIVSRHLDVESAVASGVY